MTTSWNADSSDRLSEKENLQGGKRHFTSKLMTNLWNYLKRGKQITKSQHMTSNAQINPYFHLEDGAGDVLEAQMTI